MSPALLPWWGWIAAAVVLWLAVIFTDADRSRFLRPVLVAGMVISALIGIIRFVKWVWS
jgi:hypothetical protein